MAEPIQIAKIDDDKHQVFGWANVSIRKDGHVVEDYQHHIIPVDELEDAAYEFALSFRNAGADHVQGRVTGKMIESFVVTKAKLTAMGLAEDALPQGWWIGFQIDDNTAWEKVKKGDYGMFSIEGTAVPEEV